MSRYAIVKVIDSTQLLDEVNRQFNYAACSRQPLAPGYYAVFWRATGGDRAFDDPSACYFGPYVLPLLARLDFHRHIVEFHARAAAATHPAAASRTESGLRPG